MSKKITVKKRDGVLEDFNADKINNILLWACDGINGVFASDVAMNAEIQFFDKITTKQIHEVLIDSAVELITEKTPNYQYVAGNLLNYLLRKEVFSVKTDMPHLWNVIVDNVKNEVYDDIVLQKYTSEEIASLQLVIKHKRDYEFTHAGIQQMIDKYLVQNRNTKQVYETPQYAYMLIAMTVFQDEDEENKLNRVKELYDLLSTHKISLPTPIMAGIRTPNRQYSSCVLIDTDDNLDSICYTNTAITKYVSKRAGIGLNSGRIRGVGSKIRGGEVVHTGLIPFLKQKQSSVHSCSQGGIRRGSATTHVPFWHQEIESIVVLKNNKGTDDNRVRHIDYSIQMSRLFYRRFIENKKITLFSPHDVPDLYDAFGDNEKFDALYEKYEKDSKINKKRILARDLMNTIAQERIGTGRIYIFNIDHTNINSAYKDQLVQSNLCLSGESNINDVIIDGELFESINMLELIDLFNSNKDIKILSKNIETNELEFKNLQKAWKTKENAEIYEIEDTNTGHKIKCTGCHLIYTKNRGWVEAKNLLEDDELDILI